MKELINYFNMKGIKNFLVCFWKIAIKDTANTNNNKGILLPDNIRPQTNIEKKIGIKYLEYFFEKSENIIGNAKNENKENLWIYPPAINSSPKGPPNLLPLPMVSKPNISLPFTYW